MGGYQCPGDGCGNEVSRQPTRDEGARRWVGTTCRDCEQRALDGLSEPDLARLTLDPYLRPSAVRALFEQQSGTVNAALVRRGRRYLQPSVADALGVVDDEPAVALVPFWPRYRSFDGDRQGATLAAGPALWADLEPDHRETDVARDDAAPADVTGEGALAIAATTDQPTPEAETATTPVEASTVDEPVTEVMPVSDDVVMTGDDPPPGVDEPAPSAPSTSRRRRTLLALAAVVVLAGAGLVWALGQGGDDDDGELGGGTSTVDPDAATTASPSEVSVAETITSPPTTAVRAATPTLTRASVTTSTASDATTTPSSAASASTTGAETTTPATDSSAPSTTAPGAAVEAQRWADLDDGTLYLRGTVPDDTTADAISRLLAAVAGDGDVVVEVENARSSPSAEEAPLVVRNADLFDAGSTTPTDAVDALVELGLELLAQGPDVTIEIGGHTDDVGEESANLELSRARAQAVSDALVEAGADPDRVSVRAYGETAPIADNDTEAGRAANRRIELSVAGLFG